MTARVVRRIALPAAIALAVAAVQLTLFVHDRPTSGSWFLYGTDTVSHDAPVQWWAWQALHESWARSGGELPLWLPQLQGGLPTLGVFLWTPGAPSLWLHALLPFAWAQWAQFVVALAWGGLGGWVLARAMRLSTPAALVLAVGWGLGGHVVTLIHAGHLQKVLALAWLPWGAAGAAMIAHATAACERWRGSAMAGLALGMMLLAGHPQIVALYIAFLFCSYGYYVVAHTTTSKVPQSSPAPVSVAEAVAAYVAVPLVVGLLLGALQFLPGLEMSALSNRAGGVRWEEAVETSYPPIELIEWFLPRALGDSSAAGWNHYTGAWGQRLVSDYAGIGIVALAMAGLALSRRREKWLWAAFGAATIVVGLGKYTPVYALLYEFAPGFKSFRSPATFFAGAALALPVLAAMGVEALFAGGDDSHVARVKRWGTAVWRMFARGNSPEVRQQQLRLMALLVGGGMLAMAHTWRFPPESVVAHATDASQLQRMAWGFATGSGAMAFVAFFSSLILTNPRLRTSWLLASVIGLDLMSANSAFLRAVPWDDYAAYAAPDAIDLALIDEPAPRRVWEPGRELSLRPLFVDRDALLGYHPIGYRAVADQLHATGAGSPAWRAQWGVAWQVSDQGITRDPAIPSPVRASTPGALVHADWLMHTPNHAVLEVQADAAATLELAEVLAPGWRWRVDAGPWHHADGVALTRRVEIPAGASLVEWQYRPASYRLGLLGTALGVLLIGLMMAATKRR